jgi:DNA-binding PadR family transcriptional regulator
MEDCCEDTLIECCDMRGLLSFTLLYVLSKKEMYGQELADELERRRGTRPNPGTLYPALSELEKNGFVETRKEGRKKIYSLTEEGRVGVSRACDQFFQMYGDIFEEYRKK